MMKEFPWTDDYSVGDGTIDNDHRGLFAAVDELAAAAEAGGSAEKVERVITYLVRYVNEHFQREERLMRDCAYPDFAEHRDKHRRFSQKVYAVQLLYADNPSAINLPELVEFLRGWLVRHILGADRDFAPYLKGPYVEEYAIPGEDEFSSDDYVVVDVEVPLGKVGVIRRCVEILVAGGADAEALESIADPARSIDLEQARKLVSDILVS